MYSLFHDRILQSALTLADPTLLFARKIERTLKTRMMFLKISQK